MLEISTGTDNTLQTLSYHTYAVNDAVFYTLAVQRNRLGTATLTL